MGLSDVIISRVAAEEPNLHTISVNGILSNMAIELELIVLLGSSINSVNSEYRRFNVDVRIMEQVFKRNTDNKEINKFYEKVKSRIESKQQKDTIKIGKTELKNVAYKGLDYALVYYLLIKRFKFTEDHFVDLNSFTIIIPMIKLFDQILTDLTMPELKAFADYVLQFDGVKYQIGSKILCLSRYQIDNTMDLLEPIWKTQYINRILRNIPTSQSRHLFSPSIDWGILQCVAKRVFTNANLIDKVSFGENINYIRLTAKKQKKLASELMNGQLQGKALENLKKLTTELKESTETIDYALGDIAIVMFYENRGTTIFNEISMFIEDTKITGKLPTSGLAHSFITSSEHFQQVVFQYLYAMFLLAKQGIIHNDAHLNNILLSKSLTTSNQPQEYQLSPGRVISMNPSNINLTVIDFDKSILSHHHHNYFDKTAQTINEEVGIVFDTIKKTISSDFNQVFNCYVVYDIIKFGLNMKHLLTDVDQMIGDLLPTDIIKKHQTFLDKMIKLSTDNLYKIYDPNHKFPFDCTRLDASMEWLIMELYSTYSKPNQTKSSILRATQVVKVYSSLSDDRPEFISSRRKYTDTLKREFIARYASKET